MNVVSQARRATLTLAISAAVLFAAAASRAQASPTEHPNTTAPVYRELIDEIGRTVRVPQSVRRVVSLAPSITETLYALGLQDLLAGDTDYCDYPEDARKKPKVGGAINPSIEQIAALHPDLVLVTKSLNRLETVRSLEALGIPSYATDPHTVDEIISSSRKLADVLGAPAAATAIASDLQHRLALLQNRIGARAPRRVLFVVWTEPLISIGKDTFIADALRRAGAISIVDSTQSWPQVNLEEVVRLQPEFLVFAISHSETAPRNFDVLATLPGWRLLNAVRNHQYAIIDDAVNRPAPRIITAIEDLARQLHPDAFVEAPANPEKKNEQENSPPHPPSHSGFPARSHFMLAARELREVCACAL